MSRFLEPWPFWAGGLALGLLVSGFAWVTGKALGVSSGLGAVCAACAPKLSFFKDKAYTARWKLWFLVGIPLGGFLGSILQGRWEPTTAMGSFDQAISSSLTTKTLLLFVGGALSGYGARWADGCTSGHSIVGIAQGSRSSMIATLGFMAAGIAVALLLFGGEGR
jgi:uncharacterized membrane protein YedE/YeeE